MDSNNIAKYSLFFISISIFNLSLNSMNFTRIPLTDDEIVKQLIKTIKNHPLSKKEQQEVERLAVIFSENNPLITENLKNCIQIIKNSRTIHFQEVSKKIIEKYT